MDSDGNLQVAGLHIQECQNQAQRKGIDELIQVAVEEGEHKPRQNYRSALSIADRPVNNQLTEDIFLYDGCANHRCNQYRPQAAGLRDIGQLVLHDAALEHTDNRGKNDANDISQI